MKVIIAGSRSITSFERVMKAFTNSRFKATEIVSGTANGVDFIGELIAFNLKIPIKRFPADWENFGKIAGYLTEIKKWLITPRLLSLFGMVIVKELGI